MAKAQGVKPVPLEPVVVPMPFGGVNHDSSYYLQPKGTTPDALNVVPYDCVTARRRISRRPGFTKFVASQIADGSIQDINTVSISPGQTESTGDLLSHGATSTTARVYDNTQADTTPDVNLTSAALAAHQMGCTDEDNNFYVAAMSTRTLTLVKYGTDQTTKWTTTVAFSGSGNAAIFGVAAFDGTVYVYVISQTTGAVTSPGIYRFSTAYGTQRETSPYLQPTKLAYVTGVTTAAEITVAYQGMVAGAGFLCVVGSTTSAGGNLVLQQFNLKNQNLRCTTVLEAFSTYPCKVVTDRGANIYVLTNVAGGTKKIYKVDGAGNLVTAFTTIALAGMLDVAYDPVNFQLGIVGTALGGDANKSFARYNATTGAFVAGFKPATFATWNAIAADGLTDNGTFRLRRSVAAANVDIISVSATLTTDSAQLWTLISSLGVITDTLYCVCAGLHVAPLLTSMQSTRFTRFMVVCNGGLYSVRNGESSNVTSSFLTSVAPVVYSTVNNNQIIYTDGYNLKTYNFLTGVAGTLTATAGTLPVDENGWTPRLICTWRNRTVLAGLLSEPYNWFMSSETDSDNWNYDPATSSVAQAIAGNIAEAGEVPDIVTALIPHTDNVLIFGGQKSIHRMSGNPADFGRIDMISDETGIAFGRAFCKDPSGIIYFFGTRGGIWRIGSTDTPQRISTPIDAELNQVNLDTHQVQMAWDDDRIGIHIVISPIDATDTATHYWWDAYTDRKTSYQVIRTPGSWWPMTFANKNHNALCIHVIDSDDPEDRVILWAGRDGYIRAMDPAATDDDGSLISSYVLIGPMMMNGMRFVITDWQAILAADSKDVAWSVLPGECVEAALGADARFSGTFSFGRNHSQSVRSDQHVAFLKLSSSSRALRWSVEEMMLMVQPRRLSAQRIF